MASSSSSRARSVAYTSFRNPANSANSGTTSTGIWLISISDAVLLPSTTFFSPLAPRVPITINPDRSFFASFLTVALNEEPCTMRCCNGFVVFSFPASSAVSNSISSRATRISSSSNASSLSLMLARVGWITVTTCNRVRAPSNLLATLTA